MTKPNFPLNSFFVRSFPHNKNSEELSAAHFPHLGFDPHPSSPENAPFRMSTAKPKAHSEVLVIPALSATSVPSFKPFVS